MRTCPTCGQRSLRLVVLHDHEVLVQEAQPVRGDDGKFRLVPVVVEEYLVTQCENSDCGELLLDLVSDRQAQEARCRHFEMLSARQLSYRRRTIGVTTSRLCLASGVAQGIIERIESERQYMTADISKLLSDALDAALEGFIEMAIELRNTSAELVPCDDTPKESFLEIDWRTIFAFSTAQDDVSVAAPS